MKIAIRGQVIETQNIYNITPVTRSFDYMQKGFAFTIILYGDMKIVIFLSIDEMKNNSIKNTQELDELIKITENEINRLRNEVIKYWMENQTKLPIIDVIKT